ncbi:hypothetical protein [Saccharothrix texasensis]|uniref:hypothetical protein n=1 Tax=Saccharothrix texasensis TaxID=103734 RepID=UPI000F4CBF22|nr:hypothetical protein [Saccharothrix texasensis]
MGLVDHHALAGRWTSTDGRDLDGMLLPAEDNRLLLTLAVDDDAQHHADTGLVQIASLSTDPT